jgi:AGZA family xanthine/uracil permease-like MFS transporter
VATGRWREVPIPLYAVAALFTFYYLMPALGIGQ